jgi:isoleucyl-tRNA synthetase
LDSYPNKGSFPLKGDGAVPPLVEARPSGHPKCQRCWHHRADVGTDSAHPTLCARCAENVAGSGEIRRFI